MDKKEIHLVVKTFNEVEKFKEELLTMCEGHSISITVEVLLAAAENLLETAKEIREQVDERKAVWSLIKGALKETRK